MNELSGETRELNVDFDFDRAFISPDDQYLVMNDSKMKFIAGYSLVADKLIWKKEIDDQIVSTVTWDTSKVLQSSSQWWSKRKNELRIISIPQGIILLYEFN